MYCVLIAGMPATGKSSFAKWLSAELGLPCMSKDTVKEILFDKIGFQSRAQKVALGDAAMDMIYRFAECQMVAGQPFILENNFEDSSKADIAALVERYGYKSITVLFDGDTEVLYHRFVARDQSPERHRGHVVNTAYPEMGERSPYVPMGLGVFCEGMEKQGFRRFSVSGKMIRVDSTDFNTVDYWSLSAQIKEEILCELLPEPPAAES